MTNSLIEKYNKGALADRIRFHRRCREYYRQCYIRLRNGEHFYPFGLTQESYASMVTDLSVQHFYLRPETFGSYNVIFTHFRIHFQKIRVWDVNWSTPTYFFESTMYEDTVKVHRVIDIEVKKIDKRKCRFAVCEDTQKRLMESSDCLYIKRVSAEPGQEMKIPPYKIPTDWELIFHRSQLSRGKRTISKGNKKGNTILPFPKK